MEALQTPSYDTSDSVFTMKSPYRIIWRHSPGFPAISVIIPTVYSGSLLLILLLECQWHLQLHPQPSSRTHTHDSSFQIHVSRQVLLGHIPVCPTETVWVLSGGLQGAPVRHFFMSQLRKGFSERQRDRYEVIY